MAALKKPEFIKNLSVAKVLQLRPKFLKQERKLRDDLTSKQVDKTIEDSFPASDPPSWY